MTKKEIQDFIASNTWKRARSYEAFSPHEYLVRDKSNDEAKFNSFMNVIFNQGELELFGKKKIPRNYFHFNGYKYWIMETPEKSWLINRASLGVYDLVAKRYDQAFSDEKSIQENNLLRGELLRALKFFPEGGKLIDVGSGTGLFLDLLGSDFGTSEYLGIDPSLAMTKEFMKKHPRYRVINCSLSKWLETDMDSKENSADAILMLNGVMSYVPQKDLEISINKILKSGGVFYGSAYAPNYWPETYRKLRMTISRRTGDLIKLGLEDLEIEKTKTHWKFMYRKR